MIQQNFDRFRCFDITKNKFDSLEAILRNARESNKGFYTFYTNANWIAGIRENVAGTPRVLATLFDRTISVSVNEYVEKNSFNDTPLILVNELTTKLPTHFQTFAQKLRKDLTDNVYTEQCGFSLLQSCCWDLFLERERYSGITLGMPGFHEYLLWDDGRLWSADAWPDEIKDRNRLAWTGAGWMSLTMRKYAEQLLDEPYPIPPEFDAWARQGNEALIRSIKELSEFYAGQSKFIFGREFGDNYVRALCEFLPYRRSSGCFPWLPSNGLGNPGGPVRWKGLLDDNLSMHKRHLLMDGWLSLWPGPNNKYYLQPASLALLFWAAREAGMPHTEDPEAFIKGYAWHRDAAHWFGGHWKPENIDG